MFCRETLNPGIHVDVTLTPPKHGCRPNTPSHGNRPTPLHNNEPLTWLIDLWFCVHTSIETNVRVMSKSKW